MLQQQAQVCAGDGLQGHLALMVCEGRCSCAT